MKLTKLFEACQGHWVCSKFFYSNKVFACKNVNMHTKL